MLKIDDRFDLFISPECNRKAFIQGYLNELGLECPVIRLNGKDHLYVKFPQHQYNGMFKIKTVIAHYDRVEGSPGANDNSAAVYFLIQWAGQLFKKKGFHNVRLIFTDGEEEGRGGLQSQGSFKLAELFKKLNLFNDDVFVFDSCGRGDTPILSQINFSTKVAPDFVKKYNQFEARVKDMILTSCHKGLCLPTDYSDNASFLACGIPAVTITLLPESEALGWMQGNTPKTWQLFHTPGDSKESLTPSAATVMNQLLKAIAGMKTLGM